jgi:transcriptional regulator with XRE-family HTH domain
LTTWLVWEYPSHVTTAQAITQLREKMRLPQVQFAAKVGVTVTTISRYENGAHEPKAEVLRRLAELSQETGAAHLHDFFQTMHRSGIIYNVERLSSAGVARKVSVDDLTRIMIFLNVIEGCSSALAFCDLTPEAESRVANRMSSMIHKAREVVSPYLAPEVIDSIQKASTGIDEVATLRDAKHRARAAGNTDEAERIALEEEKKLE